MYLCICKCKLVSATVKLPVNHFTKVWGTNKKQKCRKEKRVIFHPFCRLYRSLVSMYLCLCFVPHFYSRIIIHIHILIHERRLFLLLLYTNSRVAFWCAPCRYRYLLLLFRWWLRMREPQSIALSHFFGVSRAQRVSLSSFIFSFLVG